MALEALDTFSIARKISCDILNGIGVIYLLFFSLKFNFKNGCVSLLYLFIFEFKEHHFLHIIHHAFWTVTPPCLHWLHFFFLLARFWPVVMFVQILFKNNMQLNYYSRSLSYLHRNNRSLVPVANNCSQVFPWE